MSSVSTQELIDRVYAECDRLRGTESRPITIQDLADEAARLGRLGIKLEGERVG